jgi:CheY-like chemotaxis protein
MTSILIIDDEVDIRDSMAQILTGAGYKVSVAAAGSLGIAAYRQRPTDLVITDIIMPNGNGIEAITAIRLEYPKVRIIAISGGGQFGPVAYAPNAISTNAYLAAATDAGADSILTKPFDRATLLSVVREHCPA